MEVVINTNLTGQWIPYEIPLPLQVLVAIIRLSHMGGLMIRGSDIGASYFLQINRLEKYEKFFKTAVICIYR